MNTLELLIDLHRDAARQGPGSPQHTLRAFELTGLGSEQQLTVADIGCGTGAQTLTLAQHTQAKIVAVDIFPEFLKELTKRAAVRGFSDRISTKQQPMEELDFKENEFDLIWSEGAIYQMGFEEGIRSWRHFLKPRGFLAVSEISWISASRPSAIEKYWVAEYSQIDTVSNKIALLEKHGYSPVGYFVLPDFCWLDNYYRPMQARFSEFLARHGNSISAQSLVTSHLHEIELYEKYANYYSYGFYIARKRDDMML
jgi:cyclopropane fatty-acyl-phospholipid synthase-like methyltransferase